MKIRLVHDGVFTPIERIEAALTAPADGFYWIDADIADLAETRALDPKPVSGRQERLENLINRFI